MDSLRQCGINGKAQPVLIRKRAFPFFLPLPIVPILAFAPGLRVLYNRQPVFKAQPVGEPPEGEAGAPEVSEFPGTVKGGGVVIDVTMDVLLVGMRGNDKSVPSLRPAHSQLIADTVRLLRGDLPRIEGLSYLIAQYISPKETRPPRWQGRTHKRRYTFRFLFFPGFYHSPDNPGWPRQSFRLRPHGAATKLW